jgi:predicted phage terminase large subunit-like protein
VRDDIVSSLGMIGTERDDVAALRRRGLPGILPHNPKGDKTVRALAVSGSVEAGDVHVCKSKPWFGTFMDEMSNFSGHNDIHDDIVDALTQAVKRLQRVGRGVRTSGMEQRVVRAGG